LNKVFEKRLEALLAQSGAGVLHGGRRGLEKESLRVDADGGLSRRAHPKALGSALTNRYITTDFSEALLEFVTPAYESTRETLRCLHDIHRFTYANLDDELLWVASMPCLLGADDDIPLARYGKSNVARMKTIYRRGLGHRYGRAMQTIAGLHYNYSLPDAFWAAYRQSRQSKGTESEFQSAEYLGLIRNFRRLGWLVLYLFGASPALCKSFVGNGDHGLDDFDATTLYQPYATSLRMSDLGYSNKTQASINISLNSLDEYIRGLSAAIDTPDPVYQEMGVKVNGRYLQLSGNKLQIENEYYSPVRPKRVANSGERPTSALRRGGIQYVEIRSLDLGMFDPVGIDAHTMRFMEAFLIYCLLSDSPPLEDAEFTEILANHSGTAKRGRDPDFRLSRNAKALKVAAWAGEIIEGVLAVAEQLDAATDNGGADSYRAAVLQQRDAVRDPDATPSARLLEELREAQSGFFHFALQRAVEHKAHFTAGAELAAEQQKLFAAEARDSLLRQADIEAADEMNFDDYLANYYAS